MPTAVFRHAQNLYIYIYMCTLYGGLFVLTVVFYTYVFESSLLINTVERSPYMEKKVVIKSEKKFDYPTRPV